MGRRCRVIPLSDRDLLDFDASRIAHFDREEARRTLSGEHAEVYRAQLVVARWIDQWREGVTGDAFLARERGPEWMKGFEEALREVAAHLRQGDFVPGGTLYEDQQRAAR